MYLLESVPNTKNRTWVEINLDSAQHNFKPICNRTHSKICCVIKANAYGHGAVQLASLYQSLGADYLAVSNIEEALQLRQNQIILPILILGIRLATVQKFSQIMTLHSAYSPTSMV